MNLLFGILFMAIGLFSVVSSVMNWDFFFNLRKAQYMANLIGREKARIFYIIVGSIVAVIGALSLIGYITLD